MAKAIRFDKGTLIAWRFELEEPLGDGGMGVVYRAKETETGRPCAVKFIRPSLLESQEVVEKFLLEAQLCERIGAHPNIVEIIAYGFDEAHEVPYIAMELVEGEELARWVRNNAPIDHGDVIRLFTQLGAALDEAHAAGVVHRDLKAPNLLVAKGPGGELCLKVLDFGIGKMFGDVQKTATIIGTPQYCAPEQLGAAVRKMAADKGFTVATGISPATDVFAIGLIAYEVFTDADISDYWGAHDIGQLITRTATEPRANPTDRAGLGAMNLPRGFDDWFKRCTAHNAADRYPSAGEACRALVALLGGGASAFETNPTMVHEPLDPRLDTVASEPLFGVLPTASPQTGTELVQPLVRTSGGTEVVEPLAPSPPEQRWHGNLGAAPVQTAVGQTAPGQTAVGPFMGSPNAPPPAFAAPAPKNNAALIVVGALVALLVVLGTGGFFAYRMALAAADTEPSGSSDDDGPRERTRRRPRPTPAPAPALPSSHDTASIAVHADDPRWGDADAPATIVVFSDYQCPYCGRVETTLAGLRSKYGEKKLRIVWKDFPLPFHKDAEPAHVAARTVYELGGDKAFWRFHELAFNNQKDLTSPNFEAWATTSGVSLSRFQKLVGDAKMAARVQSNIAEGKGYGVRGTPAFYINGVFLSGARPQSAFETEIDRQLVEASTLLATGTPKERVYIELTNKNYASPAPSPSPTPSSADTTTVWKVPVEKDDPHKGNKDALVTIVEFSEFQCPFCNKVTPTLTKLLADYGSKLRLVWKDNPLPFHKRAVPAAMVARELFVQQGNAGFWSMHDTLFANQTKLEDSDLWGYAFSAGANVDKVKDAVLTNKYQPIVDRSQLLATDLAASGTPHFFINGRRLTGAQPEASFKTIIDEEIIRASALLARGIAPQNLYDELIKGGKTGDPLERKTVGPPPPDAPFKGDAHAPVVIQEFSDFQCPFCGRVNATLATVLSTYKTQVKLVWRHKPLPMHTNAPLAHEAAVEARVQKGDAGFWKMHDKLFANQSALSQADLERYAGDIGLDVVKFRAALTDRRHRARVEADNSASVAAGINGTPSFVINGYFVSGAQPFSKFKKAIDQALSEAP